MTPSHRSGNRDERVSTVTLSRPSATAAVVFGTLMLGLLALQLADIERQRRVAARQEGRVKQAIELLDPAVADARRAGPRVAAGLDRADRLVRGLGAFDAPAAIASAGDLARSLDRAGAAGALTAVGDLARSLGRDDRAAALVDRASGLIDDARRAGLVGDVDATRAIAGDLRAVALELREVQHRTLGVQRESLALLRESLAIQRRLLVHTRSLDRKLGGQAPASR